MLTCKKNIVFLFLATLFSFLTGCTPKIRSVFFDGVPNRADSVSLARKDSLNHPAASGSNVIAAIGSRQLIYYHPPYQNKKCKNCHDPSSPVKLLQEQPELCNNCHDDLNRQYRYIHGPVGGGQCTACHSPHQSENTKLLLRTGRVLCLYCHDVRNISRNKNHKGILNTDCQECHDPHGSNQRFFLK